MPRGQVISRRTNQRPALLRVCALTLFTRVSTKGFALKLMDSPCYTEGAFCEQFHLMEDSRRIEVDSV